MRQTVFVCEMRWGCNYSCLRATESATIIINYCYLARQRLEDVELHKRATAAAEMHALAGKALAEAATRAFEAAAAQTAATASQTAADAALITAKANQEAIMKMLQAILKIQVQKQ